MCEHCEALAQAIQELVSETRVLNLNLNDYRQTTKQLEAAINRLVS